MFTSIIKNMLIVFASFYLCDKLCRYKSNMMLYAKYLIFASLISVVTVLLKIYFPAFSYFVPAICFIFIFCVNQRVLSYSTFSISLASYVINLLFFQVISFIFCTILIIIFRSTEYVNKHLVTILISLIYPFIIICLLKIHHIYKSVHSLILSGMLNHNTIICSISLLILTLEQMSTLADWTTRFFRAPMVFLCLMIILYWWRSQITRSYREKLRLLELKTLRTAKAENEAYITKLEAENKRLGTIIHKDNRIVNAMADSVCDYLSSSANSNTIDLQAKGQSLSDEINSIKTYRQELLCQGSQSGSSIHKTNQTGVDAIISFMVKEAASYGITMKFHFDGEFFTSKHFTATEMDFVHLLSDLLENAIIATRHANGKAIELSLQILKGTPAISVSDSGIPFEIETFMKLGTCEASTHTDEGGTGIGLMDIWTFKKKYHASLVIEELDNSTYSKRLSILFDNRNKYLIISNRFQQIISNQTRSDMLVINSSTNELTELIDK